jgi:hypothetical protein
MMEGLIDLARNAEDERVRSVCLIAVLDRAGVRPIEKPEDEPGKAMPFDPRAYSSEELETLEAALTLLMENRVVAPADSLRSQLPARTPAGLK